MKNRLKIGNYLIIQQENYVKINGIGKNEVLFFDKSTFECEVFNWISKKNYEKLSIKNKKIGSYILKDVSEIEQIGAFDAIISGLLSGVGSEKGKTAKFQIELKVYNQALDIKIVVDVPSLRIGQKRIKFVFQKDTDERVFGFGEQSTALDLTNQNLRITSKQVYSNNNNVSPVAVCVTSKNRGFIIDTKSIIDVNVGKKNKNLNFSVWDTAVTFHVSFSTSISKVVQMQNILVGGTRLLPSWSFGTVIGVEGGKEVVEQEIETCIKQNLKIDAIWIKDWQGGRGQESDNVEGKHCYPNENLYPDFKNWVTKINKKGIKVLGYINLFVFVDPDCSIYKEGHKKSYFLKRTNGSDYVFKKNKTENFSSCQIDLSNESAYKWFKDFLRKNMVENGFSGWFSDYDNYPSFDAVCSSGNSIQYYCELPVLLAKLNAQVVENVDSGYFVSHRRGDVCLNKCNSWFSTKELSVTKYTKISKVITGILNSGMSGELVNYASIDKNCKEKALFRKKSFSLDELHRLCEFVVFTPMFQVCNLGSLLSNTRAKKDQSYKIVAQYARMHERLLKYIELTKKVAMDSGLPIMRPLFLQFPNDAQSWKIECQYMLGDSLMVAPVLRKNVEKRNVWLPAGNWQHVWTKMRYTSTGEYVQICAPVGYPPVFINLNGENVKMLSQAFNC